MIVLLVKDVLSSEKVGMICDKIIKDTTISER